MSEADRLTLAQWLSPAFPTGSFAWSHGLEQAIVDGGVGDGISLRRWVADVLAVGSGRSDAILLCAAMAPGADHAELSEIALALAASRERRNETTEQGRAFMLACNILAGEDLPEAPLPVAVGRAAAGLTLSAETVAAHYLFALAQALVLAAVRFMPLGQSEGQRVLAELRPPLLDIARQAAHSCPDALGNGAFAADLSAMAHETLDTRMFRS